MIEVQEQYQSLLQTSLDTDGIKPVKSNCEILDTRLYDPSLPTLAVYGLRSFEGAELLAVAADRLKRAKQPSINVVLPFPGTFAEEIQTGPDDQADLYIRHGWAFSGKRKASFFNLPQPIPVDSVDYGRTAAYRTTTARVLEQTGVHMLRPPEAYDLDSKKTLYERADSSGIDIPAWTSVVQGDIPAIETLQKLVPPGGEKVIVIKPSNGMQGRDVKFVDLDKTRQEDVGRTIELLLEDYPELIASEYIEALPLTINNIEKAAWNIRVIALNGYCGSFVRAHDEYQPGNYEQGASLHLLASLKDEIDQRYGKGFYKKIQFDLSLATSKVCELAPDTVMGLDFIIDTAGRPVLIEANIGDFGALGAIDEIDQDAAVKAAEIMIGKLACFLPRPVSVRVQTPSSVFSIYDPTARAYNRLVWEAWEAYYASDGGKTDLLTNHRSSLSWVAKLCIEDLRSGDDRYAAAYLLTLTDILGEQDPADDLSVAIHEAADLALRPPQKTLVQSLPTNPNRS